jgi:DUF971 family protein
MAAARHDRRAPGDELPYDAPVTSTPTDTGATTPARIHADRAAGRLEIEWRDGHRTVYDTTALRWLCPCAFCRGEAGMPGWLDSRPTLSAEQTRLVDVNLVGSYAIAPTWADGHHTGFYAFVMLRARCPCDECIAKSASGLGLGLREDR